MRKDAPTPSYFDCNASTPIDNGVRLAINHWMRLWGNAEALVHAHGRKVGGVVEAAREKIALALSTQPQDVVFTSGATESNNLALQGMVSYGLKTGRKHIVTSCIEHASVLETLSHLEDLGFQVDRTGVDSHGVVDPDDLTALIREDTLLVSLMAANHVTGARQPVMEIAARLKDSGIFLHVDAAQGFGRMPLDCRHIHLMSIAGHKLYGPKGVGALIVKKDTPLSPLLFGGSGGLRPGTLPAALIGGLGMAVELAMLEGEERARQCEVMGQKLVKELEPLKPVYFSDPQFCLPHVACLAFEGIEASLAISALADHISLSRGSACATGEDGPSHVLLAMTRDPALLDGALRFSWCHETAEPDWSAIRGILHSLKG